jgi:hypothetical protein
MSVLIDAEIVNVLVLAAVLEADLGSHRKITRFRLLRPILIAAAIVPLFLEKVTTHGGGLSVEIAGTAAGVIGGLIALALIRVYRSETTGKPVTAAGLGYALLWIVVIGGRALFSYGANHWFDHQLGGWLTTNSIPSAAITDGLVFMAVVMILTRTVGLYRRSRSLPGAATTPVPSPDHVKVRPA